MTLYPPDTVVHGLTNVYKRTSPKGDPWPAVREYDDRVADLQERRAVIAENLARLRADLVTAPSEDSEALAGWELDGRNGPRLEPQAPVIEQDIARCEEHVAGINTAINRVLEQNGRHVEQHRAQLVQDADAQVQEAHARINAPVEQFAQARQDLVEHRQTAVWAATFPDRCAGHHIPTQLLAGGRRKPIQDTLGMNTAVQYEKVLQAFLADADWLREAATNEQLALMRAGNTSPGAVWEGTPEGREADRKEREAARARYVQMWGKEPA